MKLEKKHYIWGAVIIAIILIYIYMNNKDKNSSTSKQKGACKKPGCSKFSDCWNNPQNCCESWSQWWACHGGTE